MNSSARPSARVPVSVYLDADKWTYGTLCTTGVSGIYLVEQGMDSAGHDPPRDVSLVVEEQLHESPPATASPSDKDARLDVLEEVTLCNIVPILPRTFPIYDLVQQVVPCTMWLPGEPSGAATTDTGEAPRAVDQVLRAAQREHLLHALYLSSHPSRASLLLSPPVAQQQQLSTTVGSSSGGIRREDAAANASDSRKGGEATTERQVKQVKSNVDDCAAHQQRRKARHEGNFTSAVAASRSASPSSSSSSWLASSPSSSRSSSPVASANPSSHAPSRSRENDGALLRCPPRSTPSHHTGDDGDPSRPVMERRDKSLLEWLATATIGAGHHTAASAAKKEWQQRQRRQRQDRGWRTVTAPGAGAIVEWASSGAVGFTRDTDGLQAESLVRLARTYYLPPVAHARREEAEEEDEVVATEAAPASARDAEPRRQGKLTLPTAPVFLPAAPAAADQGSSSSSSSPLASCPKTLRAAAAVQAMRLSHIQKERTAYFHQQEALPPSVMQAMVAQAPTGVTAPSQGKAEEEGEEELRTSAPSLTVPLLYSPSRLGLPCRCHSCCGWRPRFAQLTHSPHSLQRYLDHLHIAGTLPAAAPPSTALENGERSNKRGNGTAAAATTAAHLATTTRWTSAAGNAVDPAVAFPSLAGLAKEAKNLREEEDRVKKEEGDSDAEGGGGGRAPERVVDKQNAKTTASCEWLDDAVLDELLLLSVAPQGLPYHQRLLPPSAAFVELLLTRLAERLDKLLREAVPLPLASPLPPAETTVVGEEGDAVGRRAHDDVAWCHAVHQTLFAQFVKTTSEGVPARLLAAAEMAAQLRERLCCCRLPSPSLRLPSSSSSSSDDVRDPQQQSLDAIAEAYVMSAGIAGTPQEARAIRHLEAVRALAAVEAQSVRDAVEDAVVDHILTALRPVLYRRSFIMYELLRLLASKSLYAANKALVGKYQSWYVDTPSPGAVLRLLQRGSLFRAALARAFPAIRNLTHTHSHPQQQQQQQLPGLSVKAEAEGRAEEVRWSPPPQQQPEDDTVSGEGETPYSRRSRKRPRAVPPAEDRSAEPPPPPPPPLRARGEADGSANMWSSLRFVPECALLHPEYLERFTTWVKQTYHSGSSPTDHDATSATASTSSSSVGASGEAFSAAAVIASIVGSSGGPARNAASVAGFTDAALNAVLRSLVRKGRTMTAAEMDHFITSTIPA